MAKQVLPVNFTDDLLAESMDGKRKYRIIDNGDGTVSLEDVSEYLQMGSVFGAGQMNSTNQAVNDSVDKDKILKTLEEVSASTDSDAVVGRGAVDELNKNLSALNGDGAITGMTVESDGAYISYTLDGEIVKKKLGEPELISDGLWSSTGTTSGASIPVEIGASYILMVGTAYSSYNSIMKSGGELILRKKKTIGDMYVILEIVKATEESITMGNIAYVEYYQLTSETGIGSSGIEFPSSEGVEF